MKDIVICSDELFIKPLKPRYRFSNKGDYGKVYLIAGSKVFAGASLLSFNALSSLMMGVGYSFLCVPSCIFNKLLLLQPEILLKEINDNNNQIVFDKVFLDEAIKHASTISIGMGLGVSLDVYKTIDYLLRNFDGNLILDADALNSLAKYGVDILSNHKCNVIITPHIKEFSRLTKCGIDEIKMNTQEIVENLASKYSITIVLKDAYTYISDGKSTFLNKSGNTSLAKAGSGDVLSGILAGLITNTNMSTIKTCAFASYFFGRCAEEATNNSNEYSLLSRDVIAIIPMLLNKYL